MPNSSSRSSHLHRAVSLHRKGNVSAAVREYQQYLAAHPGDKVGHYHLAVALEDSGRSDAATYSYAKALQIDPYYPEALNNLGILLHSQGNLDAARICFARALAARPDYLDAEYNYATVESDAGNHQAALLHFSRVLERDPKRAEAWNNLGKLFLALRQPSEAQRACEVALALKPGLNDAIWNRSIASLTLGNLANAWAGFESRGTARHSSIPRWRGEVLTGKNLLIHAEQGVGDVIQFVRYYGQVQADHITLECHPELLSLLTGLNCVPFGTEFSNFDFQIPLMSLPGFFGTSVETIPARIPYIQANPDLIEKWNRRMVAPDHSLMVGVVWAGNPRHKNDRNRSIDPGMFQPLSLLNDVSFYCLQQRPQSQQAAATGISFAGIFDQLTWPDTAAILMNLDLVITVDTAVAHLAGALGRPVWTLLPYAPDWRWMLDRSDSPWYSTMRLFRQPHLNDWQSVMGTVAAELRNRSFAR
jgi:tetratricopeptide (TPR) repeat protein